MCLLRGVLKPPQAAIYMCLPWGEWEGAGADGTHCLERFWKAGVVVEPPWTAVCLGECSCPAACLVFQEISWSPTMAHVLICFPLSPRSRINLAGFCKFFLTLQAVFCGQEGFAQTKGCHVLILQPGSPACSPALR